MPSLLQQLAPLNSFSQWNSFSICSRFGYINADDVTGNSRTISNRRIWDGKMGLTAINNQTSWSVTWRKWGPKNEMVERQAGKEFNYVLPALLWQNIAAAPPNVFNLLLGFRIWVGQSALFSMQMCGHGVRVVSDCCIMYTGWLAGAARLWNPPQLLCTVLRNLFWINVDSCKQKAQEPHSEGQW